MKKPNTRHALSTLLLSIRSRRRTHSAFENDVQWEIALFVIEASIVGKSIDVSGLAHVTGRARNTIAAQVGIMENEGFLSSITDSKDQRRKVFQPTENLWREFDSFAKAIAPDIARASYKLQVS
ncbi:hypothetical protein [uncultured Sneathiella sp.]|jgi:DNA-binding MarR family transcriptional regulator|uniref:hypothetical protein n=1 Tax=uncultured Sneathiella sp. TaxID=879315 RepID=UPI0030DA11ED|tara:strand:- start:399 stop:770 length:372 start_codon:yes stop_codon:yes gene_type:complete